MYRSERQRAYRRASHDAQLPKKKISGVRLITIAVLGVAVIVITLSAWFVHKHQQTPRQQTTGSTYQQAAAGQSSASPQASDSFNKQQNSLTNAVSLWVIVNKQHPLSPKTYTPANLVVPNVPLRSNITSTEKYVRADMAKALQTMVTAAAAQGVHFNLQSGYRSYNFQVSLYNGYAQSQGQAVADRQSARPGYSEHQTGLAADLGGVSQPSCNVAQCFADTTEGKWLAANAYTYGFLVRYTADKESTTGYEYEPWHIRYVGTELAAEMHTQGIETLEEFFGVSGGTSY